MDAYVYSSLPANHIRLLIPNTFQNETTWSLQEVLISSSTGVATHYDALSYTWGSSDITYPLICDGKELQIHHNLHILLPYLLKRPSTLPLWIDAICINQKNDEEKVVQIALMSKIYPGAQQVWIWLGCGEEPVTTEMLQTIFPKLKEIADHIRELPYAISVPPTKFDLPILREDSWTALSQMLCSPWFLRLWIVQEAALARKIEVMYGDHVVDWEELNEALYHAREFRYLQDDDGYRLSTVDSTITSHTSVSWARKMYLEWTARNRTRPVSEMLQTVHSFTTSAQCFEARDRVLALIGLSGEHSFQLDPRMSVPELYAEFMHLMFSTQGLHSDIDVFPSENFQIAINNEETDDFPSWCPDWHHVPPMTTVKFEATYSNRTSKKNTMIRRGKTWREMIIRGTLIDTVLKVSDKLKLPIELPAPDPPLRESLMIFLLLPEWEAAVAALAHDIYGKECLVDSKMQTGKVFSGEDYWWLLQAGHHDEKSEISCEVFLEWREVYAQISYHLKQIGLERFIETAEHKSTLAQHEIDAFLALQPLFDAIETKNGKQVGIVTQRLMVHQANRQMFTTNSHRMGLAQGQARQGDRIVLFDGAHYPHIIRKRAENETWELVGEAVVWGCMNGEVENWGLPSVDITLT